MQEKEEWKGRTLTTSKLGRGDRKGGRTMQEEEEEKGRRGDDSHHQ